MIVQCDSPYSNTISQRIGPVAYLDAHREEIEEHHRWLETKPSYNRRSKRLLLRQTKKTRRVVLQFAVLPLLSEHGNRSPNLGGKVMPVTFNRNTLVITTLP